MIYISLNFSHFFKFKKIFPVCCLMFSVFCLFTIFDITYSSYPFIHIVNLWQLNGTFSFLGLGIDGISLCLLFLTALIFFLQSTYMYIVSFTFYLCWLKACIIYDTIVLVALRFCSIRYCCYNNHNKMVSIFIPFNRHTFNDRTYTFVNHKLIRETISLYFLTSRRPFASKCIDARVLKAIKISNTSCSFTVWCELRRQYLSLSLNLLFRKIFVNNLNKWRSTLIDTYNVILERLKLMFLESLGCPVYNKTWYSKIVLDLRALLYACNNVLTYNINARFSLAVVQYQKALGNNLTVAPVCEKLASYITDAWKGSGTILPFSKIMSKNLHASILELKSHRFAIERSNKEQACCSTLNTHFVSAYNKAYRYYTKFPKALRVRNLKINNNKMYAPKFGWNEKSPFKPLDGSARKRIRVLHKKYKRKPGALPAWFVKTMTLKNKPHIPHGGITDI